MNTLNSLVRDSARALAVSLTLAFLTSSGSAQDKDVPVPELETLKKDYASLVQTANDTHLAAVAKTDKKHIARLERAQEAAQQAAAHLRDDHARELDALVAGLTKEGKLEEALTVRRFRENLPATSAAASVNPSTCNAMSIKLRGEMEELRTQVRHEMEELRTQVCNLKEFPCSRTVGIDLKHGKTTGLTETLVAGGFSVVPIDQSIDAATLKKIGVLMIIAPTKPYADTEVQAIAQFVKAGGGLLCAGQAWSWTYQEYDNQPLETYPLNVLGKQLNFTVTGENAGTPTHLDTEIMAGIERVERTDWWPSKVAITSKDGRTIVQDETQRSIGGLLPLGEGRIVVYGHASLLKDNPKVLVKSVAYVGRLP